MRGLAIVLCAPLCALLAGCGSIGEPLYPALRIPNRVTDLNAVERGDQIDVTFTISPQTTEGLTLKTIGKIELRIGPNAGSGFDLARWVRDSEPMDFTAPSAPGFVLKRIPAQRFIGKDEVIAVRVANEKGRFSDWSFPATVSVGAPLATPAGLKAEATPQGVSVTWTAPEVSQFRLYRRSGEEKTPTLLGSIDQPTYLDTATEYGKTYDYFVEAVRDKAVSEVAGPESITPKDIFPPAVPTGLTASAGVGAVELAWERNTESDFKEYRVLRAEAGANFAQIAAGLESPNYSDRMIQSGKTYRYRILAVDQIGNASEPCSPIEVSVP